MVVGSNPTGPTISINIIVMIHKLNINSWLEYALKDGLQTKDLASNSSVYQNYCKERDEIEKHKWLESEKAGEDIISA